MKEGKELYKKAELPAGAHVEPCPVCGADAELWQYSKDFKNGPIDKVVMCANGESLVAQNARYRAALETMTKCEPCDCGCPGGQKPVLMKPQHYYAIAREALGVGIDESRDVAGTGSAHCPMTKAANSDADCVCCDSVPTPNVKVQG